MRILVTGAAGFVGKNLLEILSISSQNTELFCVSRQVREQKNVNWIVGDILNQQFVKSTLEKIQPDVLVHLAWDVTPGKYVHSAVNFDWLKASIHLVDEFIKNGGKRIIGIGTCFEYDLDYGYLRIGKTPLKSDSSYATSKIMLNEYIKSQCSLYDKNYVWARLFYIYGPHERPERLVPTIINGLLNGESPRCGVGTYLRDFMYVKDVAQILKELVYSEHVGEFNIASGYPVTIKEIGDTIKKLANSSCEIIYGEFSNNLNEPHLITSEPILFDSFEVKKTKINEGLIETIEWWREHANLSEL